MTQEIVERIIDETVDTLIDSLDELIVDYMYQYGDYTESNDQFLLDKEVYEKLIVRTLYNRVLYINKGIDHLGYPQILLK